MERGKEAGRNGGSSDKHKPALFQLDNNQDSSGALLPAHADP